MTMTVVGGERKSNRQHKKPCHDCPWRKKAVSGWLGPHTADEWLAFAHGEAQIPCHTVTGKPQPQCAGSAIYRANICKRPRDPAILQLPADRENVFEGPPAFILHHDLAKKKKRR